MAAFIWVSCIYCYLLFIDHWPMVNSTGMHLFLIDFAKFLATFL